MGKPELVILAAGIGSRYGGLKQIEPVGPDGEIIVDYSIHDAIRAGFEKVVFVIRQDIAEVFRETIGNRFEGRMDVAYVYQELADLPKPFTVPAGRQKPWGTGHALLAAEATVKGPFAIINADDFYGQESYRIIFDFLIAPNSASLPQYAMVGFPLRNTLSDYGHVSRGICSCDAQNRLVRVEELTHIVRDGNAAVHRGDQAAGGDVRLTGDEFASMNMWGFTPDVFARLHRLFCDFLKTRIGELKAEFYLPGAVDQMLSTGEAECHVLPTPSRWAGVTYKEDRALLQTFLNAQIDKGHYPRSLWR